MKKTDKILLAIGVSLVISIVFTMIYTWEVTGSLYSSFTVRIWFITLLNVLFQIWVGYKIYVYLSNKPTSQLKKWALPLLFLFFVVFYFFSIFMYSLGEFLFFLTKGVNPSDFPKPTLEVLYEGIFKGLTKYSLWALVGTVLFFYIIWRKTVDSEQKLREENLKYLYRTLKTQVNPHFLFNSLNTLSEILYTDIKKADNYIHKLSEIYRYILDNEKIDLVPLDKELEFVRHYFDLQKVRDEDKIRLEIETDNAEKFKIVPISLQILIENALKHNAASEEKPLIINIFFNNGYVIVSNIIQRKNILSDSHGTGLSNLRERVKLITGKEVIIYRNDNLFSIKIPVIITN